jgi:glucose dehydrogenase
MCDYFWSARFITGVLTLALGLALLIGGALYLSYGDDAVYELALGAALCLTGPVLAAHARAGLALYVAVLIAALAWSLAQVHLNIWLLLPRLAVPLLWGGVLFTLRWRIAPARDPSEPATQRVRRMIADMRHSIRGLS